MRAIFVASALLMSACALPHQAVTGPVDASKLPPLSSEERALILAGDGAVKTGAFAQAERNYQDAVKRSQGHIEAHLALGRFYLASREYAKASAVLEQAASLQPDHEQANYLLGKAYLQQGLPDKALAAMTRGLKTASNDPSLLSGTAIANDAKGLHKIAQDFHQKALAQAAPRDRVAFTSNLAMSYLLDDQAAKAVALLEPQVKKPGAPQVLRHNLALAYGLLGRDAEARALLKGELSEEARRESVTQVKTYIAKRKAAPGSVKPEQTAIHNATN